MIYSMIAAFLIAIGISLVGRSLGAVFTKKDFYRVLMDFLENVRILAKDGRDFWGLDAPCIKTKWVDLCCIDLFIGSCNSVNNKCCFVSAESTCVFWLDLL